MVLGHNKFIFLMVVFLTASFAMPVFSQSFEGSSESPKLENTASKKSKEDVSTATGGAKVISEPDYYNKEHITNNEGGTISINTSRKSFGFIEEDDLYLEQDAAYLINLAKDPNISKEDIAKITKKYPHLLRTPLETHSTGGGPGFASQITYTAKPKVEFKVLDQINADKKLSEKEKQRAAKKIFDVYDEYLLGEDSPLRNAKGEIDVAYVKSRHGAINRAYRDGSISEEYKKEREELFDVETITQRDKNSPCKVENFRDTYQKTCYSCHVVKLLVETFMKSSVNFYDTSKKAASKILVIGVAVWLAIYVLKQVSSFASVEPANMINDIITFLFKALVAYVFINSSVGAIVGYTIDPLMAAGADYGVGVIQGVSSHLHGDLPRKVLYHGPDIVGTKAINKMFEINVLLDRQVSTNLVIGNVIMCHANHAGAWLDTKFLNIPLFLPNLWLLFCGAVIWFVGFMLTLAISYYLIDISFKLGLSIILLPLGIAFWVFDMTKDKLAAVISIILKSAAILAFLSITTSYAFSLIDHAMSVNTGSVKDNAGSAKAGESTKKSGIEELYERVEAADVVWVSEKYSITGAYFILIVFAYAYSILLIGGTIENYVNKFFSDKVFGNKNPMHQNLTQMTSAAKGIAQVGASTVAGVGLRGVKSIIRNSREEGGSSLLGNGFKLLGQASNTVGNVFNNTGKFLTKTKVGAVVGVPLSIVGQGFKGLGEGSKKVGDVTNQAYRAGRGAVVSGANTVKDGVVSGAKAVKDEVVDTASTLVDSARQAGGSFVLANGVEKAGEITKDIGEGLEQVGNKLNSTGIGAVVGMPIKLAGLGVKGTGSLVEGTGKVANKTYRGIKKGYNFIKGKISGSPRN